MILKKNKIGCLSFCDECNEYHLQFNNIFISLHEERFNKFRDYIIDINPYHRLDDEHELIEEKNIVLPILHPYMIILINIEELHMLKKLILLDDNKVNISIDDFPFNINSN